MANRSHRPPLTLSEIARIRERYAEGVTKDDLAASFGVGKAAIYEHTRDVPRPDLRTSGLTFGRRKKRGKTPAHTP